MEPRKKKNKLYIVMILTFSLTIYFFYQYAMWELDNRKNKELIKEIQINYLDEFLKEDYTADLVNPPNDISDSYYNYVDIPYLNINFEELKSQNNDTVGWINIPNTLINYPIVKTKNNDFYLTHSFDKTENKAGRIFSDYRNNLDYLNNNSIIYGHRRNDESMFGSLKYTLEENWLSDLQNHIVKISTPQTNMIFQVFSVYVIPSETYYLTTHFLTENDYQQFLTTIKNRSIYDFQTSLNTNDKVLTLSTCKDGIGNERVVLHAKLIKKEIKS